MARIDLKQALNLNLLVPVHGKPVAKTIELKRGVNDLTEIVKPHGLDERHILTHPFILAHIKHGTVAMIPDPMDPEAVAAAAEEIARRARAEAEAARSLKVAEQKKVEDALAAASAKPERTPEEIAKAEHEELERMLREDEAAKAAAAGGDGKEADIHPTIDRPSGL